MLPLSIILIFLQFAHFPLPIYGGAGGGVGPFHSSGKGVERKVGEDERHNFIISIAIKNYDGGMVTFLQNNDPKGERLFHRVKNLKTEEENKYFEKQMQHFRVSQEMGPEVGYPFADILKIFYGIEAKYLPTTLEHFENGASLEFLEDVNLHELGIIFKKGQKKTIWEVANLLANDGNWGIMAGQFDETKVLFQCHFNGHAMVALSLPAHDQEGKEIAPMEVIKFHTNQYGLNVFVDKTNFIAEKGKEYVQKDLNYVRTGRYVKEEFTPRLYTRSISIGEMKEIAWALMAKYGGWHAHDYSCRHFTYTFIDEIKMEAVDLSKFEAWPHYFRRLDVHNRDKLHHTFCFEILEQSRKEKEQVHKGGFSEHIRGRHGMHEGKKR